MKDSDRGKPVGSCTVGTVGISEFRGGAQECIIPSLRRLKEGKQKKTLKGAIPWKHVRL